MAISPNPFDQFDASSSSNPFDQFDAPGKTAAPAAVAKAPDSALDSVLRTLSLGGRSVGEGVLGALAAPHDIGNWVGNKMAQGANALLGTHIPMKDGFGQQLSDALTSAGAPVPETENEKTGTAITRGISGALTGAGLFGGANAVRTGISGATGATAGDVTRRMGGGPIPQFLATVAGGAAPWIGAARALPGAGPSPYVQANASITPGVAAGTATASGTARATARGGGSFFGTVGPDESAALTSAQQKALDAGKQLGFRSTPGQDSGSRSLQQMEAKLESQPMTSGPFNTLKTSNQKVLNRTVAGALGHSGDVLDSDALGAINERLGNVFENTRSPNRILMGNPAETSAVLDKIDGEVSGLLPNNGSIRDNPLVQQLETLAKSGSVTGQQLGSLTSKLGRAAYKQMSGPNGDRDLGHALYAVKDHVDDLVQSTLNPAEAQAYAAARQQYRNLMLVTSRTNIINPSTGNVSGVALANKLQQADKSGFLYGKNQSDWYNAARFAQAFKPIVGDSGTATRSMINSPLDMALSVPFNLMTRLYLKTPGATAAAVAGAPAAVWRGVPNIPRGLFNPQQLPGMTGGLLGQQDRP